MAYNKETLQGKFTPRNPDKYVGDVTNIVFRSSWEKKVMIFFDNTPSILKWNSEETIVPYISPLDKQVHRYFTDFTVMYKKRDGLVCRAVVEVKPKAQTVQPKKPSKVTKRYINELTTFMVNQAKWDAAEKWCEKHGFEFMVLTEDHLFGNKS